MKVDCLHGYFKFTEERAGQLSGFASLYGFELARRGDHFTFATLAEAPTHAIKDQTWLGASIVVTVEGEPWEIMEANGLVYDFLADEVVPIEEIDRSIELDDAGSYFVTTGMIQPGSVIEDGSRVTDYAAYFEESRQNFKYSEIGLEDG